MDTDRIIIIQGGEVGHPDFDYRINVAAFLDFSIRISAIAHE